MGGAQGTTITAMDRGASEDGDRLAELYVRFAPGGIRLAYLMTGDRALAEDLVQEAFVRFVGRLHSLRDPGAFDTTCGTLMAMWPSGSTICGRGTTSC